MICILSTKLTYILQNLPYLSSAILPGCPVYAPDCSPRRCNTGFTYLPPELRGNKKEARMGIRASWRCSPLFFLFSFQLLLVRVHDCAGHMRRNNVVVIEIHREVAAAAGDGP